MIKSAVSQICEPHLVILQVSPPRSLRILQPSLTMRLTSALLGLAAVGFTTAANYANTTTTTTTITPPPNPATACPTVISTTNLCRTCAVPACLVISTLTQHCKCPNEPAVAFTSHPCELQCKGIGCATTYKIVTATGCYTKTKTSEKPHTHTHTDDYCEETETTTETKTYTKTYHGTKTTETVTHTKIYPTKKPYHPPHETTKKGPPPATTKGPTKAATPKPPPATSSFVTAGAARLRSPFGYMRLFW
ncbi:hypothetical protein B0T14DRAFT_522123 [Immersiella caudata]|uniref:Uncharacterized protein n=1 Tax=Immersiella caudata TaxID=314043 RepID=A0AA39WT10_9PEZI|nr:hypothetical protein B0T14DRAFT_522123 [Immersiella caudata]